jgi:ribose-phosphate pyrophosphokinase
VAALFEAVGVDRFVTLDVHNLAAFQNAFRCPTDHLEARGLFADYFTEHLREQELVVISPDVGGVKRAEQFRRTLSQSLGREIPTAFMEKHRSKGVVSGEAIVGEVRGRVAVIIDDLISTGNTMLRAARACLDLGAERIYAAASHGLFTGDANAVIDDAAFTQVVVTDTVPPFRLAPEVVERKLKILDARALFAEAIRRLHSGGSLSDLVAE